MIAEMLKLLNTTPCLKPYPQNRKIEIATEHPKFILFN